MVARLTSGGRRCRPGPCTPQRSDGDHFNVITMSNQNPNHNHPTSTRKSKDPKYKRIGVGVRQIPMTAAHVDALDARRQDGRYVARGERCPLCWLKSEQLRGHFCAKRIENAVDPDKPPMLEVHVWGWVPK